MRWDDLNMGDKSRMIKLAVDSGITDLRTIRDVYNSYAEGGNLFGPGGGLREKVVGAVERFAGDENNVRRLAKFAEKHPKTTARLSRAIREIIPEDKLFSTAVLAHKHAWDPAPLSMISDEFRKSGVAPSESPTGSIYGEWADPGNSYLLSPDSQKNYMERLGYHLLDNVSDSDYGLVKSAATALGNKIGRVLPVYQRGDDYITRDKLVPIYNGSNTLTGDSSHGSENPIFYNHIVQYDDNYRESGTLSHAGAYPFAVYAIPETNEYVYKAWDLNDYGNHGSTGGVTYGPDKTIDEQDHQYLANLYDILGEPFVQTTGYTLIPSFSGKRLPTEEEYNEVYDRISGQEKYTTDRSKGSYYISADDMNRDILSEVSKELLSKGYLPFVKNVKSSGGKIHIKPENHDTLFAMGGKPKRRKTLITELPEVTVTPQWLSYWEATPEQTRTLTNRNGKYNTTSMGDKGYTHFDTISARYKGLNAAMQRANFSDEEMSRLSPFLLTQLALEGGWVVDRPDNNFGGMMSGEKRIEFDTEDSFYDTYLKNLDARWGDEYLGKGKGWRNAKTINEYANIINREDLGLHTKAAFDEYNRKHRDHPAYIYTPLWENNNTGLMDENKFGGIYDRALGNYELLLKRMEEWDKFARNNKIFAK